ncbi:MAG: hypothetical protein ACP5JT_02640 [Thermoplasmata archaeon]|jgi:hypothetical protein
MNIKINRKFIPFLNSIALLLFLIINYFYKIIYDSLIVKLIFIYFILIFSGGIILLLRTSDKKVDLSDSYNNLIFSSVLIIILLFVKYMLDYFSLQDAVMITLDPVIILFSTIIFLTSLRTNYILMFESKEKDIKIKDNLNKNAEDKN